jgi:hypothetical protein
LHKGQPQTFMSSLPALLRLQSNAAMLRPLFGCAGQPRLHSVPADRVSQTPSLQWSVCPFDLLDSPHLQAVRNLDRLSRIAPLSPWPRGFAAWAVAGLLTIRGE